MKLLRAAGDASRAPAITGDDADRSIRLDAVLRDRVPQRALENVSAMAAMYPRAKIVDRARAAVADLRDAL